MEYSELFKDGVSKILSEEELSIYFEKYRLGDLEARDVLIKSNIGLVLKRVLRSPKFYSVSDPQDLFSIGIIGLIKAIDSFVWIQNTKFYSHAIKYIDYELYAYFRKEKKQERVNNFSDMDVRDREEVLIDERVDIVSHYEDLETSKIIKNLVLELPLLNRQVITLFFGINGKKYTQQEIAYVLHINQYKVSRIISRSLKLLRAALYNLGMTETEDVVVPKRRKRTNKKNDFE